MLDTETAWRMHANQIAYKLSEEQKKNKILRTALEEIRLIGYIGDPWVDKADAALKKEASSVSIG